MARFNTATAKPRGQSYIQSAAPYHPYGKPGTITVSGKYLSGANATTTHQGGPGFSRDTKSELFLLAVSHMSGEPNFYESSRAVDTRFAELVRKATREDAAWTADFLVWLRTEANIRTSAIVGAAEFTKAMLEIGKPGARRVVAAVIQRADEPGEMLAYWTSRYGKALPMPLKRGIADAVIRLGNEFNYLKYDSEAKGFRFADILNLTHPGDKRASRQHFQGEWQRELFGYATTRPYRDVEIPPALSTLTRRNALMSLPVNERRAALEPIRLREAGMTWEALAGWLQGPMDKEAWEAVIPNMGYMALLRNLRNFDKAGVSDSVAQKVAARLADPEQVAKSRQLPMRFLSAYRAAPSLRWSWPLEQALNHSLTNITPLSGRTLILVDTSASMSDTFSKDGTLNRMDAAALFGIALASRCDKADLVSYSSGGGYSWGGQSQQDKRFHLSAGESVLSAHKRWADQGYFLRGGTDTPGAVARNFSGHDRVVILTDEQTGGSGYFGFASYGNGVGDQLPGDVPLYTWNLAGYKTGHTESGAMNRHTFGGLTDTGFKMIPLLESGANADWPWVEK